MYYYGGGSDCGCSNMSCAPCYPYFQPCNSGNNTSNYAIVLVLFILLVIVIGSRFSR